MRKYILKADYLKALDIVKKYEKQLEDGFTDEESFLLDTPLNELNLSPSIAIILKESFPASVVEEMAVYDFWEIVNTHKQGDPFLPKIGVITALKIAKELNNYGANIELPENLI